jgi:hypothetical protein
LEAVTLRKCASIIVGMIEDNVKVYEISGPDWAASRIPADHEKIFAASHTDSENGALRCNAAQQ